jgi:hypothetical protein
MAYLARKKARKILRLLESKTKTQTISFIPSHYDETLTKQIDFSVNAFGVGLIKNWRESEEVVDDLVYPSGFRFIVGYVSLFDKFNPETPCTYDKCIPNLNWMNLFPSMGERMIFTHHIEYGTKVKMDEKNPMPEYSIKDRQIMIANIFKLLISADVSGMKILVSKITACSYMLVKKYNDLDLDDSPVSEIAEYTKLLENDKRYVYIQSLNIPTGDIPGSEIDSEIDSDSDTTADKSNKSESKT